MKEAPKFPHSIWDGTVRSRLLNTDDKSPDNFDADRYREEIVAIEEYLLTSGLPLLFLTEAPTVEDGSLGQFALDYENMVLYGPKGQSGWGSGTALGGGVTVHVHSTSTGAAGSSASVSNFGTETNVELDFVIPRGVDGSDYTLTAASSFSGHRVVVQTSSGIAYADPGTHIGRSVGLTLNAASGGQDLNIRRFGEVTEPSWSWDTSKPVWLGVNGTLTQTIPNSPGSGALVLGWPLSSTTLDFQPGDWAIMG